MSGRSAGTTESERLLARLAQRSFLRFWTYANVYRDQAGGKELCDLLVVFDEDVVIFSDKDIAFTHADTDLGWQRWVTSAIDSSVRQLRGARGGGCDPVPNDYFST